MGDHGMDVKGDHGGESDDEVEAALWMYSKRGIFGRSDPAYVQPPATAKNRPVGQIDLVPTLALLLGMPVPFNNLGKPIEEAFIQKAGNDYQNLAEVNRLTAAQINRYQAEYAKARNLDDLFSLSPAAFMRSASEAWRPTKSSSSRSASTWKEAYNAFAAYQIENLRICKDLWARFDLVSMSMGIAGLVGTFAIFILYAQGVRGDHAVLTPGLLLYGVIGTVIGGQLGAAFGLLGSAPLTQYLIFGAMLGGIIGTLAGMWPAMLDVPYPKTFFGSLCTLSTLLLCVGFAANSFTIWEDEQLLFILTTFGMLMLASSLGLADTIERNFGALHSVSFLVATRLSSFSRLCREEQMPNCTSTYYASATSSTSASWQTLIPFVVALLLPSAIRYFYVRSKNYQGSAVIWIGIALRIGLVMTAAFWVLNAADDGDWYPQISKDTLKDTRTIIAQIVLAVAFAAGYSTYIWASPLLYVKTEEAQSKPTIPSKSFDPDDPTAPVFTPINGTPQPRSKLMIYGYAKYPRHAILSSPSRVDPSLTTRSETNGPRYPGTVYGLHPEFTRDHRCQQPPPVTRGPNYPRAHG